VAREERRGAYRVLVGKPEGKRPLGGLRHKWEEIGWRGAWTGLTWLGTGQVESSCEQSNELSVSIRSGECFCLEEVPGFQETSCAMELVGYTHNPPADEKPVKRKKLSLQNVQVGHIMFNQVPSNTTQNPPHSVFEAA
jgi:hypothetical protein